MTEYRVQFTVEAQAVYDAAPAERRAGLDRAVRILASAPFSRNASAPIGAGEHFRRAYAAPGVRIEYMVAGAVVIVVVLEIFDEFASLVDESDAG
jgi:hypothetical protein